MDVFIGLICFCKGINFNLHDSLYYNLSNFNSKPRETVLQQHTLVGSWKKVTIAQ
jgi:hypothetical protein